MSERSVPRLRPTMLSDLDFVVSVETDAHNRPFITPWERTQHEAAIRFPDFRHFIVEGGDNLEPAGFLILNKLSLKHCLASTRRATGQVSAFW